MRMTKIQKEALKEYMFQVSLEERYLGSVFVTPSGQANKELATKKAYDRCKELGLTWQNGL